MQPSTSSCPVAPHLIAPPANTRALMHMPPTCQAEHAAQHQQLARCHVHGQQAQHGTQGGERLVV